MGKWSWVFAESAERGFFRRAMDRTEMLAQDGGGGRPGRSCIQVHVQEIGSIYARFNHVLVEEEHTVVVV